MISLLTEVRTMPGPRVPIFIHPQVRKRLRDLLWRPEFREVGYSVFINRACEAAEAEILEQEQKRRG